MRQGLLAIAIGLIVPGALHASTFYESGSLLFETQERQSVWGEGAAAELSGTYFAGAQWNEKFEAGDIVGRVSQTNIPDVTFST
jgi:hypothetical protein